MIQRRDSKARTFDRVPALLGPVRTAADYYNIPTNCVIELGTKIEI